MADNNDWRQSRHPNVRPLGEKPRATGTSIGDTADINKSISGLIKNDTAPEAGNPGDKPPEWSSEWSRDKNPSDEKPADIPVKPSEGGENDYADYFNSTTEEIQRANQERQERREQKRQERETAVMTVKSPRRSGVMPEVGDTQGRRTLRATREETGAQDTTERDTQRRRRPDDGDPRRDPNRIARNRAFDSRADESGSGEALRWPEVKYIAFGICIIILAVFVVMTVLLIGANNRAANAEEALNNWRLAFGELANNEDFDPHAAMQEQHDTLMEQIRTRDATILALQAQLEAPHHPGPGPGQNGQVTDPGYNGQEQPPETPPDPPPDRRSVVVQTGETLSAIARRELGDANRWREIMEYNNLPNENVGIGQTIYIPSN